MLKISKAFRSVDKYTDNEETFTALSSKCSVQDTSEKHKKNPTHLERKKEMS